MLPNRLTIFKKENMKAISKTMMMPAVLLLFAASCDKNKDYSTEKFVSLDSGSHTVKEDVKSFPVKVYAYNVKKPFALTVHVTDGKAKQDADYTLKGLEAGVLNFAAGETEKTITVNVHNHKDVFTGALDFALTLTQATNDVRLRGVTATTITIQDLDHPLMAYVGEYTAKAQAAQISGGAIVGFEDETWTCKLAYSTTESTDTLLLVYPTWTFSPERYASYFKETTIYGLAQMDGAALKGIDFPIGQEITPFDAAAWFGTPAGLKTLFGEFNSASGSDFEKGEDKVIHFDYADGVFSTKQGFVSETAGTLTFDIYKEGGATITKK